MPLEAMPVEAMPVTAARVTLRRRIVLMDLDGTISDPADGVFAAFRHAVAAMGRPWPDDRPLDWVIGPPLRESFARVLGDETAATAALEHYRVHYAAGSMFDNQLYPGIVDAIGGLCDDGVRLYVATSKLNTFAAAIMARFGLAGRFAGIYGSTPDCRVETKADVIASCLAAEGLDPADCLMVGDREHDVLGARDHGIGCIGVTWGYGSADELAGSGAVALCDRPAMLPALVADVFAARSPASADGPAGLRSDMALDGASPDRRTS